MKSTKQKWWLLTTLVIISPIVISSIRLSSFTYPLLWVFTPILIYSILPRPKTVSIKILAIISAIIYGLVGLIFLLRFILCGYGKTGYEYTNKENNNLKIIGRDFSCYGTTGDLVLYKQFSITSNVKVEFYYKTFPDYENVIIDSTFWKRTKNY